MANVRIKDLSTTASTTASDDFFGVDGATNGTRKLNAYSPTFGGNLTVSGTGGIQLNSVANLTWGGSYGAGIPTIAIPSATSIGFYPTGSTSGKTFELFGTGNATLSGNLTVSGGTVTSGTGTLTLNSSANTVVLQSAGTTALTLDSSQRTILSGALRLANAYVATPQVSTGYVTIQDSTGTTYKVLVAP